MRAWRVSAYSPQPSEMIVIAPTLWRAASMLSDVVAESVDIRKIEMIDAVVLIAKEDVGVEG